MRQYISFAEFKGGAAASWLIPVMRYRLGQAAMLGLMCGAREIEVEVERMLLLAQHCVEHSDMPTQMRLAMLESGQHLGGSNTDHILRAADRAMCCAGVLPDLYFRQGRYREAVLLYERYISDTELLLRLLAAPALDARLLVVFCTQAATLDGGLVCAQLARLRLAYVHEAKPEAAARTAGRLARMQALLEGLPPQKRFMLARPAANPRLGLCRRPRLTPGPSRVTLPLW